MRSRTAAAPGPARRRRRSKIGSTAEASSSASHRPGERLLIISTSCSGGTANRGGSSRLRSSARSPGDRHPEAAVDGDQRQAALRVLGGERRRDRAAPGVADDDGAGQCQRVHGGGEVGGDGAQVIGLIRPVGVAVTALVEREDRAAAGAGDQPPGDRVPEPPLRGQAVQQHDGRAGAGPARGAPAASRRPGRPGRCHRRVGERRPVDLPGAAPLAVVSGRDPRSCARSARHTPRGG